MKIYKVGGAVRDALLDRPVKDNDYVAIECSEKEFLYQFPAAKRVGRDKPVYLVNGEEYTVSGVSRIEDDLVCRDLTINALAIDDHGHVTGLKDSLSDLSKKLLRPVSVRNFFDDPLRVFRAARFAAEMPAFTVTDELLHTIESVTASTDLSLISAERIGQELMKACDSPNPSIFFEILSRAGGLYPWFKELQTAADVPAGPVQYHSGSVFEHICDTMDKLSGDPLRVYMGLCHDFGKLLTCPSKWPHHYGHDKNGVDIAEQFGSRLKLSGKWIRSGGLSSQWHMTAGKYNNLRPGTKVDMLMALHKQNVSQNLFAVVAADTGVDFWGQAESDLKKILSVKLSEKDQNQGVASGEKLRMLRAQELAGR